MPSPARFFLRKALESLASAEADLAAGRFNSCANRSYYATFQLAVGWLMLLGERPDRGSTWTHGQTRVQLANLLVSHEDRGAHRQLARLYALRLKADYSKEFVTAVEASMAIEVAKAVLALARRVEDRVPQ